MPSPLDDIALLPIGRAQGCRTADKTEVKFEPFGKAGGAEQRAPSRCVMGIDAASGRLIGAEPSTDHFHAMFARPSSIRQNRNPSNGGFMVEAMLAIACPPLSLVGEFPQFPLVRDPSRRFSSV